MGSNEYGQAGNNSSSNATSPQKLLDNIEKIDAQNYNSCAIDSNDKLYCWGRNSTGQIGNTSTSAAVRVPYEVMGM